ncbi:hypothetical protein N7509_000771 [Penicillium cosmopolitanum]|uniref:Uncharacterized protein n=1 Tax=Penicillium cosmopolitanum TaxID=1131564 RepID=A0A9W9WAW5_9EURO|nr:uncharacterized protein N7509_000771 [Penicillium cosmopolitanum]KAJ5414144.1 hypothetical protein N7509_000771 [Penicillium cosmopolitanum]
MTANLQSLSATVSTSIDGSKPERPDQNPDEYSIDLNDILEEFESGAIEDDVIQISEPSHNNSQQLAVSLRSPRSKSPTAICLDLSEGPQQLSETPSRAESISERVSSLAQEIPSIWSFDYQMGTDPYTRALSSNQSCRMRLNKDWTETNSPFSDHIQSLRTTLKSKVDLNTPKTGPAMLL